MNVETISIGQTEAQQKLREYATLAPERRTLEDELLRDAYRAAAAGQRPSMLSRYHILFEVERWQRYPVDPFLLRHIAGPFYTVEAEWELSALEASLLSALAS